MAALRRVVLAIKWSTSYHTLRSTEWIFCNETRQCQLFGKYHPTGKPRLAWGSKSSKTHFEFDTMLTWNKRSRWAYPDRTQILRRMWILSTPILGDPRSCKILSLIILWASSSHLMVLFQRERRSLEKLRLSCARQKAWHEIRLISVNLAEGCYNDDDSLPIHVPSLEKHQSFP